MDCMSADLRSMRIVNIKEDLEEGILLLGDLKASGANIYRELECAELLATRHPETCLETLVN